MVQYSSSRYWPGPVHNFHGTRSLTSYGNPKCHCTVTSAWHKVSTG